MMIEKHSNSQFTVQVQAHMLAIIRRAKEPNYRKLLGTRIKKEGISYRNQTLPGVQCTFARSACAARLQIRR